jgi:hypothetical protein
MKEASLPFLFDFIKTFVIHGRAKRALERRVATKDQEVNISLFTVERSSLSIPAGSWPKMQDILRASFVSDPSSTSASDTDTAATKAIKILQDKIQTPPKYCSAKSRKLLANFKGIIQETPIHFHGGMHCETVLATLSKHFELSLKEDVNASLTSTCKVLLFMLDLTSSNHLS